ncbi:MAG: type IV pili methyl-accepting chemotaxis transducer N-terminal domain-containing protein [Cocleimonas sp.]
MALSKSNGASRYRSLIIVISLFVLVIVSVLSLNFYAASVLSSEGKAINIAGRQRMLSQKQAKTIPKIFQSQLHNKGVKKATKEMKLTSDLFDSTLKAFTNGGEVTSLDGKKTIIKPLSNASVRKILLQTNEEWDGYKQAFDKVIKSDIEALVLLGNASHLAEDKNKEILTKVTYLKRLLVQNKSSQNNINLVSRLEMQSQQIPKDLYELIHAQTAHEDQSQKVATDLRKNTNEFNAVLDTLMKGGSLKTITDSTSLKLITEIKYLWQPLSSSINDMLKRDLSIIKNLSSLHTLAHTKNNTLLALMDKMTIELENNLDNKSTMLGYIQLAGIILALGMFGFIMMYFLKYLKQTDAELNHALGETSDILTTINDGVFLIDQDHVIGKHHSGSLPKILNIDEPAGENFLSILATIVPDKTVQVANEYLELLYGEHVHADLVGDLNPLDQVEVFFAEDEIEKKVGYLSFDFKRVNKKGDVPHLLVQVENITKKVILERQLEETKDAAQEQFDMMLQVLHVQPKVLAQFLEDTEKSLFSINDILKIKQGGGTNSRLNVEKINSIARYIHKIKGDASGLQLQGFEQKAHEFEDLFATLKGKTNVSGKDFLPIVIKLEEFLKQLGSLRSMINKLSNLKETFSDKHGTELQIDQANNTKMSTILNILVNSVASRQNKNVILNIFNEHLLPKKFVKPIHDILIQLIRNSIVHGIEDSKTRQEFNKTDEGVIAVKFFVDSKNHTLTMKYIDNGKGLNSNEILASALSKGLINHRESLHMSEKEAYALILKSGFSTKLDVDTDAGRGVGMDVVYDIVKHFDGNISINSVENQIFKLDIVLPMPVASKVVSEKPALEEA